MNVQRLIKKYNNECFATVSTDEVLEDLKQLDKPEKVKVPQFVADWYEERKNNIDFEIWHYLHTFDSQKEDEFKKWMNKLWKKQIQTLVNMHQFGYEVEKEKRYKVVMPNVSSSGGVLTRIKHDDSWIWIDTLGTIVEGRIHTRKELEEAGFGWVFDCPGIEIEEVKE